MAEQKKQAEEKKNLQVRVDREYALLVAALAQARGHSTVAELIKELLDEALRDTQNRFEELKKQVQDRYAAKAQSEIEALEKIAAETAGAAGEDAERKAQATSSRKKAPAKVAVAA